METLGPEDTAKLNRTMADLPHLMANLFGVPIACVRKEFLVEVKRNLLKGWIERTHDSPARRLIEGRIPGLTKPYLQLPVGSRNKLEMVLATLALIETLDRHHD